MRAKFYIHIAEEDYELKDEDISNWDEIRCSYKRSDFDSIVRSFTSQFTFVNKAKDLLLALYLKDGFNAQASVSVHVMNDRWEYEKRYECPFDFSTITWDAHTLSINCIDSSLEALIKSKKGTKFEFSIPGDIKPDDTLVFDRIPMIEYVTYGLTQGESHDDGSIDVTFTKDVVPWLGVTHSEISVNRLLYFKDDQDPDDGGYCLKAVKNVNLTLNFSLEWLNKIGGQDTSVDFAVLIKRNQTPSEEDEEEEENEDEESEKSAEEVKQYDSVSLVTVLCKAYHHCGTFTNPGAFPSAGSIESDNAIALLTDGTIYRKRYNGREYIWDNTGLKDLNEFLKEKSNGYRTISLKAGDTLIISGEPSVKTTTVTFVSSSFKFEWKGKGEAVEIKVFKPTTIADAILNKISGEDLKISTSISDADKRIANTYLFAAESARGLEGAKFYASFNEFCDWMSTVFGYVYQIGDVEEIKGDSQGREFPYVQEYGSSNGTPVPYEDATYEGVVSVSNIVFYNSHSRFMYFNPLDGKTYLKWSGWEAYNSASNGYPRTDTLFFRTNTPNIFYYFDEYTGGVIQMHLYEGETGSTSYMAQKVNFIHRKDIFSNEGEAKEFEHSRDLKYSVDTSAIYSTVTIGYDKQDYDSINGRDEFNFSNTYSTGCSVSDKTLSLLSKFRADCYGIEFTVQKRGIDTTDDSSDQNVFFILCTTKNGKLYPDRSISIANAISADVFNGAFSPMACVRANAGLIGLQADKMLLSFASSTGNSDIVINGESMTSDLTISTPLATCGVMEFTTSDIEDIADADQVIRVECEDVVYTGFLKEVDIRYTMTESVKYKLIVKNIEHDS